MTFESFVVGFRDGCWCIGFDDHWYGSYHDNGAAQRVAVAIAMQMGELPTRVVVRERDGTEEVVWQPTSAVLVRRSTQ
jgi:hypothetical protein